MIKVYSNFYFHLLRYNFRLFLNWWWRMSFFISSFTCNILFCCSCMGSSSSNLCSNRSYRLSCMDSSSLCSTCTFGGSQCMMMTWCCNCILLEQSGSLLVSAQIWTEFSKRTHLSHSYCKASCLRIYDWLFGGWKILWRYQINWTNIKFVIMSMKMSMLYSKKIFTRHIELRWMELSRAVCNWLSYVILSVFFFSLLVI